MELTSSHSRTQCFLFLTDKNWCSSCASFSPFLHSFSCPLPPSPSPLFSSAWPNWLCITPSFVRWERGCQTWLCLGVFTLPLSLIPPPCFPYSSLLSQGGRGGSCSPSPFLSMYCIYLQLKWEMTFWFLKTGKLADFCLLIKPQACITTYHTGQAITRG